MVTSTVPNTDTERVDGEVCLNNTMPLQLREQAAIRDRWLEVRLNDLLPDLMTRADIDLWLVIGREYNEDPILSRRCCPPNGCRLVGAL